MVSNDPSCYYQKKNKQEWTCNTCKECLETCNIGCDRKNMVKLDCVCLHCMIMVDGICDPFLYKKRRIEIIIVQP